MLKHLFSGSAQKIKAFELYQALVAQARSQAFYRDMGVADTIEGRFDMILLHVWLLDQRLEKAGPSHTRLRRYIQEALVSDMDRSLRELGVGDMSVGKEMKKVGAALLGRKAAYSKAFSDGSTAEMQIAAVAKNIYGGETESHPGKMVDYINTTAAYLADQEIAAPEKVSITFPTI